MRSRGIFDARTTAGNRIETGKRPFGTLVESNLQQVSYPDLVGGIDDVLKQDMASKSEWRFSYELTYLIVLQIGARR